VLLLQEENAKQIETHDTIRRYGIVRKILMVGKFKTILSAQEQQLIWQAY
jgi:hypothetical protein